MFTQLSAIKPEMIAEATINARAAANQNLHKTVVAKLARHQKGEPGTLLN